MLINELLFSQVTRYQPKKMPCNYHHNLLVPVALKVIEKLHIAASQSESNITEKTKFN